MATKSNIKTHLDYFYKWEKETPDKVFLKQPYGDTWKDITYKETGEMARKLVTYLKSTELEKGDHIGLMSKNCYHWVVTDLAIMMGGYVSVPYYASLPKEQLKEVIEKSDIKLIFLGKLDAWGDRTEAIPEKVTVVKFPHYEGNAEIPIGESLEEIFKNHEPFLENYQPKLDDVWTVLFTSGTTGSPKGVIHSYYCMAIILENEFTIGVIGVKDDDINQYISFLPLNHVAERTGIEGMAMAINGTIGFVESIDTFAKNIQDLQPTMLVAVPRIWTKFKGGILAKIPQKRLDLLLKIPIVSTLIKKKIKKSLGLSRAKVTITAAALLPTHMKRWFGKLDINLREAYGSTEGGGLVVATYKNDSNEKGVGKPVAGFEFKIEPDTGEILYKGEQLMKGYYKEEAKTAEVLVDGWYYSGDKGYLDEEGNVYIIGRVKDSFKTDKGKYIIPTLIEEPLSKHEFIENLCLVGLSCPQPMALIELSEVGRKASKDDVNVEFKTLLNDVNGKLTNYEKISTLIVTEEPWTVDNDLLTPTLKVKRGKIDERYRQFYDAWGSSKDKILFAN